MSPEDSLQRAIDLTLSSFQANFPVCDGDQLVGILTQKRLVETLQQRGAQTPIREAMQSDLAPVSPDDGLFEVQQRLAQSQLDALPVTEGGKFLGLITQQDIAEIYRLSSGQPGFAAQLESGP